MTPQQKLKHKIIATYYQHEGIIPHEINESDIDGMYDDLECDGVLQDAQYEVRCSGIETGLECDWSRHYESEAVAAKMPDGTWVGWTYWYGGGKHAEPESIDWISDAYDLDCTEKQVMQTVREFTRK